MANKIPTAIERTAGLRLTVNQEKISGVYLGNGRYSFNPDTVRGYPAHLQEDFHPGQLFVLHDGDDVFISGSRQEDLQPIAGKQTLNVRWGVPTDIKTLLDEGQGWELFCEFDGDVRTFEYYFDFGPSIGYGATEQEAYERANTERHRHASEQGIVGTGVSV